MKKSIILVLLIAFASINVRSQKNAVTTDGEKVYLYDNGTWKFAQNSSTNKYKQKFLGLWKLKAENYDLECSFSNALLISMINNKINIKVGNIVNNTFIETNKNKNKVDSSTEINEAFIISNEKFVNGTLTGNVTHYFLTEQEDAIRSGFYDLTYKKNKFKISIQDNNLVVELNNKCNKLIYIKN